ncbi:MAG TPA: hypothetical protein V6D19_11410 [Stenomitos sp.]
MAIKGYGNVLTFDANNKLYVGRFSQILFQVDVATREVDGYPFNNADGALQIVDAFVTRETFNCQISTGSFDKSELARVFDQTIQRQTSIVLPVSQQLTVANDNTLTVSGLTVNQSVGVFQPSDTDPKQLTQITSGSPTADQYSVTANTITFHSSKANQTVIINYLKTHTNIDTIGATNNPVGDLSFVGRLIGPRFPTAPLFYIPKMSRFSGFNFGGENSEITYRATVKAPFAKPIIFAFDVP